VAAAKAGFAAVHRDLSRQGEDLVGAKGDTKTAAVAQGCIDEDPFFHLPPLLIILKISTIAGRVVRSSTVVASFLLVPGTRYVLVLFP
jgi:hypothetical protein